MRRPDWFLIAIALGTMALVLAALFIAVRLPAPEPRDDDTAAGAAHDYLLSLSLREYDRAWGYLSPSLPGYPTTVEQFLDDVNDESWAFGLEQSSRSFDVSAETSEPLGDRAVVTVLESSFTQAGLFDSGQTTRRFEMTLAREGDEWRLVDGERYWHECWSVPPPCRRAQPDDYGDESGGGASGSDSDGASAPVGAGRPAAALVAVPGGNDR